MPHLDFGSETARDWAALFSDLGQSVATLAALPAVKEDPRAMAILNEIVLAESFEDMSILTDLLAARLIENGTLKTSTISGGATRRSAYTLAASEAGASGAAAPSRIILRI